ncbi:hypothetical protein RvY_13026 [Ramazzottius varieornatus]|uniref:Vacuolar fusion protein MON1 homolog n=1 Tax=Ramazzottius varieornatus TaxID=947166 RepID=A0A1D1VQJ7_RAMVA|nr:hypothetical protein RvY_13026 [Ramazzottius varieornatus]
MNAPAQQNMHDTFESTVLEAVECLQPGSSENPIFENAQDFSDTSVSSTSNPRQNFTRLSSTSSLINEIRASTAELEVVEVAARTERLSVGDTSEVIKETIRKMHVHRSRAPSPEIAEVLEENFVESGQPVGPHLTCTSNYLSQEQAFTDINAPRSSRSRSETPPVEDTEGDQTSLIPDESIDYTQDPTWRSQKRHLFILSDSGKAIYSRHGEEDRLVTLCGVMQALVSVINDTPNNHLWNIRTADTIISFLVRSPLILVTVAKTDESDKQLLTYLNYAYDFVLSVLTLPQLQKIFSKYQNFDLRRMLSGTEKILDSLIDWFDEDFGFLLGAVRCLPLPVTLRDNVSSLLTHTCQKTPGLVFGLLIAKKQLVCVSRLKNYILHPSDIRLLINLISSSDSLKTAESWIPVCLPKFDSGGFLYVYISYVSDSPLCLVYLGVDPNLFHALAKNGAHFVSKMVSSGYLGSVLTAMSSTSNYTVSQTNVFELRHFVYKSASAAQLSSPVVGPPYHSVEQRVALRSFYRFLHRKMHTSTRATKIIVVTSSTEMLLGWVTANFEVYAVLEPWISKHQAVLAIEKLIRWIKKEEHQLFILNSTTFS